jgi:hypothetical protein
VSRKFIGVSSSEWVAVDEEDTVVRGLFREQIRAASARPLSCGGVSAGTRLRAAAKADGVRFLDSYASLLALLTANFFLLELVDDRRWGAIGSTLLSAAALVVAISDPQTGDTITRRQAISILIALGLSSVLLFSTADELVGLAYLLPAALLVTATLPVTLDRVLHHKTVTFETILGAVCIFVLVGLLFAFVFLAVDDLRDAPFFAQEGPHEQSEYVYFSFVALTTLGFGDLSPTVGLPQALTVVEAIVGQIFLVTLVARLVTLWVYTARSDGR